MTSTLNESFHQLKEAVASEILERNQEVHTAVLAILGRKHHFQIGPPGTAKSLLVDRLHKRIAGMEDHGYFRWLVTNYTTPEELFGGPDFMLLRDKGIYKRVVDHKLPKARIAFLDEIFKGNSSILNANLTIMNERLFFNADDDPNVPLISMFAASNEMPSGDALWALWDRLHFRHEIKMIQESSSFHQMISTPIEKNPEPLVRLEDIYQAHEAVDNVIIPEEIYDAIVGLRSTLSKEGVEATERRWVESVGIIKAEAFMNGREYADIEDMRPLMHVLWSDLDHQRIVKKTVLELANPIDREASDMLDRLIDAEFEFKQILADGDNPKAIAKQALEVHNKNIKTNNKLRQLEKQAKESGRKSEYLDLAKAKFLRVATLIAKEGFGLDVETLNDMVNQNKSIDDIDIDLEDLLKD